VNYSINADSVQIGKGVVIEDGVKISGMHGIPARRVAISDNIFIGRDSQIYVPEIEIGDYTMIHNHALISGDQGCKIGSCCWFGQNCILNSTGGLFIGNGVGVGAYSQLWSHIRFGDILQGCRWDSRKPLVIEDDVWFVGHCIVSPIHAKSRSMALIGSVVTKDMEENHIYAGVPAQDVTDKLGFQYEKVPVDEKFKKLSRKLEEFYALNPHFPRSIVIAKEWCNEYEHSDKTIFDVSTRTYTKRLTPEEIAFMKFLLVRIKFYPRNREAA
jgi:acetyltransferase-like isoleucine patch superfamily enzyme